MFDFLKEKKEENTDGKIIERDLGFIEDTFGFLTDCVAFEDHCINNYLSTEDEENLKDLDWMRKLRTYYLDLIAKKCKGNDWCKSKHLLRISKGLQEDCARFMSIGDIESAKKCAKDYGEVYSKFIKLIGGDYVSDKTKSSA